MGRLRQYPIETIEKDYIINGLSFSELKKRYSISKQLCAYHSRKNGWVKKRQEYLTIVNAKALNSITNAGVNEIKRDREYYFKKREKYIPKAEQKRDFSSICRLIEGQECLDGMRIENKIDVENKLLIWGLDNPAGKENLTELLNKRLAQNKV